MGCVHPPVAAMKEFLDSDRVNFLVWRYLLEGNYRETAAKLQKEWHIPEPHRHFDFAPHVKSHALISVLNKGLQFYSLERELLASQPQVASLALSAPSAMPAQAQSAHSPQSRAEATPSPQGVFGPLITQPPLLQTADERSKKTADGTATPTATTPVVSATTAPGAVCAVPPPPVEESETTRKRQIDSVKQQHQANGGSPAKKPKLSNGATNGLDAAATAAATAAAAAVTTPTADSTVADAAAVAAADIAPPTPMEIDSAEGQNAYPSPMERDSAPALTPAPLTEGPEQSTQVDKVEELALKTTFLLLSAEPSAVKGSNGAVGSERPQPDHVEPVVLHCEWNPRDPLILAVAGTDALARIWTISRSPQQQVADPGPDHVSGVYRPYKDLVDDDIPHSATVMAMAWNPDGSAIALATGFGKLSRVSIWGPDGTSLLRHNVQESPIIKLRWSPNGALLLGITPHQTGTLLTVFDAFTCSTMSHFLADHDLEPNSADVAWVSESDFLLCSGDMLVVLHCGESISTVKTFSPSKDASYDNIQYDAFSKIISASGEKGCIDLWDEDGERRTISAHDGPITCLTWQPLPSAPPADERLLASAGEDGIITLWNARLPDSKPVCKMSMGLPVAALAFTPDGAFLAGATSERILIWKVGDQAIPRASWRREPHPGWNSLRGPNGELGEEDTHLLCWDTTGQKLAYGVNNRLAVIDFR